MDSRKISLAALFGALSAALEIVPGIPMPGAEFLKFDIAEAPVLVLTLMLGYSRGLVSLWGIAIAIIAVKGDPLGAGYKLLATAFQAIFLRVFRSSRRSRGISSFLRALFMTIFDRLTIPLIRGVPVGLKLASLIFVFNFIQGIINASVAVYAYRVSKEAGMLCMLGLEDCQQGTAEGGF